MSKFTEVISQLTSASVPATKPAPVPEAPTSVLAKLSRDLSASCVTMTRDEIRFLVKLYYQQQDYRIAMASQLRSLQKDEEPHELFAFLAQQEGVLESQIKTVLDKWSQADPLAAWSRSILGVGPVIASGLRAHIDFNRVQSVGQIWSFAGLTLGLAPASPDHAPMKTWEKGQKRPFNVELRSLCAYKLGESFVKVSGNENSFYGKWYKETKARLIARNDSGGFAANAALKLEKFRIGKTTDAYSYYSNGKLPPAHIHAMARRATVKLFLSHYFDAGCVLVKGIEPPMPWIIAHGGHVHYVKWTEVQ